MVTTRIRGDTSVTSLSITPAVGPKLVVRMTSAPYSSTRRRTRPAASSAASWPSSRLLSGGHGPRASATAAADVHHDAALMAAVEHLGEDLGQLVEGHGLGADERELGRLQVRGDAPP